MSASLTGPQLEWTRKFLAGAIDSDVLGAAAGQPAAQTGEGGDADALAKQKDLFKKMGDTWIATEANIRKGIKALGGAIVAEYKGDENAAQMEAEFEKHVDRILQTFDGDLEKSLHKASACTTMAELEPLKAEAEKTLTEYSAFVSGDAMLATMDGNPYVHLDIVGTCRKTLDTLAKSLA